MAQFFWAEVTLTGFPATSRRRCCLPASQSQQAAPFRTYTPFASHYGNRETLVRRQATEPHLKDGGIYRMRWWAFENGGPSQTYTFEETWGYAMRGAEPEQILGNRESL